MFCDIATSHIKLNNIINLIIVEYYYNNKSILIQLLWEDENTYLPHPKFLSIHFSSDNEEQFKI